MDSGTFFAGAAVGATLAGIGVSTWLYFRSERGRKKEREQDGQTSKEFENGRKERDERRDAVSSEVLGEVAQVNMSSSELLEHQKAKDRRASVAKIIDSMIDDLQASYAGRVWAKAHSVSQQASYSNKSPGAVATEQIRMLRQELQRCYGDGPIPDVKILQARVARAFAICEGKWNQFQPPEFEDS